MMNSSKHSLAFVLSCALVFATAADIGGYASDAYAQVVDISAAPVEQAAQQTSEPLEQLVAPIALYPDPLVAQILAASPYPSEVVEAWRWMQGHPSLAGQLLADAVDPQPWDPSVKAVTQFPSVLDSMNTNLAWTSALGDAYVNQPQDVLDAVQALRQRAQSAGSLESTNEQTVTTEGPAIAIEPADPDIVYVPEYDPWVAYGVPLAAYPGWVGVPGVFRAGPDLYSGVGLGVGLAALGWGWHNWGVDWHGRTVTYHRASYISDRRTSVDRGDFDRRIALFDQGPPQFGPGAAPFDSVPIFHDDGPERVPAFGLNAGGGGGHR